MFMAFALPIGTRIVYGTLRTHYKIKTRRIHYFAVADCCQVKLPTLRGTSRFKRWMCGNA